MKFLKIMALASSLCMPLILQPAAAHHSFAQFDQNKFVPLTGTVKEFQWTNPHAWLQIMAIDEKGQQTEWSLELGSPNNLSRSGLKRTDFKPGDKITIEMNPMRDGSHGGSLRKVTMTDGRVVTFGVGANQANFQ